MSNKHDAYITLRDAGMLSQSLSPLGTAVIFEEFAVAHISRAVEQLDTRLLRVTLCLGEQAWHLLPVSTQMAQAGKQAGRQVGRQAGCPKLMWATSCIEIIGFDRSRAAT
jgi:hypothetical protein